MKSIIVLTAVSLLLTSCGHAGSSDSGNSDAATIPWEAPTGVYKADYNSNGKRFVYLAYFTPGYYELREYQFPNGSFGVLENKFVAQVSVSNLVGESDFSFNTTLSTCGKIGGDVIPSQGTFAAMRGDGDDIYVSLPAEGGTDIPMASTVGTIDQAEASLGIYSSVQDPNCN